MRIAVVFLAFLFIHQSSRIKAGTYLATDVGCKKWREKNMILFSQQANLSDFVRDSQAFFEHAIKSESPEKISNLYKEYFSSNRTPSSNEKFYSKYNFSWKDDKLVSTKSMNHITGFMTRKNSGIDAFFELKKRTKSLDFSMVYNKENNKIETFVIHHFDDGSDKIIPLDNYVLLNMPKSCKHHYKISENTYFKNEDLLSVQVEKIQRIPAKQLESTQEVSGNQP